MNEDYLEGGAGREKRSNSGGDVWPGSPAHSENRREESTAGSDYQGFDLKAKYFEIIS